MDLTTSAISELLTPLAAFSTPRSTPPATDLSPTWLSSYLNPKNRINSLDLPRSPKWRIEGSANTGTEFFAIPTFLSPLRPLRVDTFIPPMEEIPSSLHEALDIHAAIYTRDARVSHLGISRYIILVLTHWSNSMPNFSTFYNSLPFGSRILFHNITTNISSVRVQVLKTHFLERQFLSLPTLQSFWSIPPSNVPPSIDISHLHLLHQLHDSVSLIQLPNHNHSQRWIFKSLTSSPKYMYHELKVLLSIREHKNVISRPKYLVTKQTNFGAKISVVGFLLPYYPNGTLRDELRSQALHGTLKWEEQARWAVEIAQALIHLRDQGVMYCDLRTDNIVLNENNDIVLIDFESRGVSTFMSAPEVTYLEYILALSNEEKGTLQSKARLWETLTQGIELPHKVETYRNPRDGYCLPWLCLSEQEREEAQVYMLGRVLWCIFEGVGSPEKSVVVQHAGEGGEEMEFPEFKTTPKVIRELIVECCDLRREGEYRRFPLTLNGRRLCLREVHGVVSEEAVRDVVRRWWRGEVELAEEFLKLRMNFDPTDKWVCGCRPSMKEVLRKLESL
ncbi:hypothetical protein BDZ45DRAFT_681483 [Acephala macrosclerotiorum]|nr:hypothetical protein BDZ45DRAFT_681483 [Acephala macrosclerotiorum]